MQLSFAVAAVVLFAVAAALDNWNVRSQLRPRFETIGPAAAGVSNEVTICCCSCG